MVPGKCLKCKTDIVGPPHDRGGDQSKTWYKYCRDCHSAERRAKYRGQPRSIQQVEEVDDHHEPDGVFGPVELTHGCFMVNIHRSEKERVTTKVLNVLTDGRPNKGIVDYGVIVDSGAAVTLTNLEVVDSRRIVDNSIKVVEPPVIIQGVGGKPVKCTSSCSMYVYYTDSEGEPHKFILDNCYICNVVRTPLVSAWLGI